jgi:FkbM family methyltransferase
MSKLIGSLQQAVSRSRMGTRVAMKLRNQCNCIIGLRCKSGIDAEINGEAWLADQIAPRAQMVIDVGANVGDWTAMFAQRMTRPGHAILFEPNPEATAILRNLVLPNRLRVDVQEKAVADMAGTAEFFIEPDAGETSSLVREHSRTQAQVISVPVVTLDEEMAVRGGGEIDMLKIDAEGYDLRVLIGARGLLEARQIGAVQFEYNFPWAHAGSTLSFAFQLLRGAGYRVFLLKAGGLYRFEPDRVGEYFRYSNFVALREDVAERVLKGRDPPDWL